MVLSIFIKYNKELHSKQMDALLVKDGSSNPLWLAVACEELRVYGQFRYVGDKIKALPGTILE